MTERLTNIWGKEDCGLPNGKLCRACSRLLAVNFGFDAGPWKQYNTPCPYEAEAGKGCSLHPNKPINCQLYHCAKEEREVKFDLVAKALSLDDVSLDDALKAASNIMEGVHESEIRQKLRARSGELRDSEQKFTKFVYTLST